MAKLSIRTNEFELICVTLYNHVAIHASNNESPTCSYYGRISTWARMFTMHIVRRDIPDNAHVPNNVHADDVYSANQIIDLKSASTFKNFWHQNYFHAIVPLTFNYTIICQRINKSRKPVPSTLLYLSRSAVTTLV